MRVDVFFKLLQDILSSADFTAHLVRALFEIQKEMF